MTYIPPSRSQECWTINLGQQLKTFIEHIHTHTRARAHTHTHMHARTHARTQKKDTEVYNLPSVCFLTLLQTSLEMLANLYGCPRNISLVFIWITHRIKEHCIHCFQHFQIDSFRAASLINRVHGKCSTGGWNKNVLVFMFTYVLPVILFNFW